MRKFIFSLALSALATSAATAQSTGPLDRAAAVTQPGCKVHHARAQRMVIGICSTKEQAAALKERLREVAAGQAFFGPICNYTVTEPRKLRECEVQVEARD